MVDRALATPLAGIKVLEFSHTVMGPTAGLIFAELGADVVKVEPAPKGDHTRALGGFGAGFFAAFNRNKRSLAIDLKRADGQAAIHRLVRRADIVLENYGPGTMERLGCGYDQLAALNPRLIYLALKGYLAGPYEHRPALDEVVQFQAGLAFMTGPPGQPLRAGASVIDIMGAMFGVIAVQAALRERDASGKGQRVSSALFENAAFLMSTHMAGITATGLDARPMPAHRGAWAIYEVFKTAGGGQLFIGVTSDQQWTRFVEEFGLQELAADPRLATNVMRLAERSWLIPVLQEVLATLPQDEVAARCERCNVSWAPVGAAIVASMSARSGKQLPAPAPSSTRLASMTARSLPANRRRPIMAARLPKTVLRAAPPTGCRRQSIADRHLLEPNLFVGSEPASIELAFKMVA
jgi:crotonobetainyl-CoA:carnitine CoA-transferase CaiB-like acyl-CoA transferase